jgi:hypothetical protein
MQRAAAHLGFFNAAYSYSSSTNLNSGLIRLGFSFMCLTDAPLTHFAACCSNKVGSPSGDAVLTIYEEDASTANNTPGTVAVGSASLAAASVEAGSIAEWSFLAPLTLVKGRRYWGVVSLPAATSTDYLAFSWVSEGTPEYYFPSDSGHEGGSKTQSTDSGATWTGFGSNNFGFGARFSDGSSFGLPCKSFGGLTTDTTTRAELGGLLTLPKGAGLNLSLVAITTRAQSITGSLQLNVYEDRKLVRAATIAGTSFTLNSYAGRFFHLDPPQLLEGGREYGFTVSGISNTRIEAVDAVHESYRAAVPFDLKLLTVSSIGEWTVDPARVPFITMGLSNGEEFRPPRLDRRQFFNQR